MSMKVNRVRKTLREGGVCFGTMLRLLQSPQAIPLAAAAGWDYVILDTEHNACNPETLASMAVAARYEEIAFLVRVPDTLYHLMAQTLDLGAEGLILPRVDTSAQVEEILKSTRYFPLGRRGASISGVATLYRQYPAAEYLEWANRETLLVIQVESQEAVERIDELVGQDGIDAVMIGPFDLSQSLGIPGQMDHPRMAEAYQRVIEGCRRHGVAPGIHLTRLEEVAQWVEKGMRLVTYQYDAGLFRQASADALRQLKSFTDSLRSPSR